MRRVALTYLRCGDVYSFAEVGLGRGPRLPSGALTTEWHFNKSDGWPAQGPVPGTQTDTRDTHGTSIRIQQRVHICMYVCTIAVMVHHGVLKVQRYY